MSGLTADLGRCMWSADYVLAHCEGFRVESDERKLGYVEEVVRAGDRGNVLVLRVRAGFDEPGIVTVPVEDIVELHPAGERIVVRTRKDGRAGRAPRHWSPVRPKQRARAFEREPRPALKLAAR